MKQKQDRRCKQMPSVVINLHYLKINSISGNGSITIGEASYNSPTAYNKSQGMNSSYGDTSPTEAIMENLLNDPDVNDQTSQLELPIMLIWIHQYHPHQYRQSRLKGVTRQCHIKSIFLI